MKAVNPGTQFGDVLFEYAPVGLAFLDTELRYVRLNPALAEINGMPVEAHIGRSVPELWPDLDPRVVEHLRRVLDTGEPILDLELQGTTPAAPGDVRSFIQSYRPVVGEDGKIVGLNCSVVEITRQKAVEHALRRARDAAALLATLNGRLAGATTVDEVGRFVIESTGPTFEAHTAGAFVLEGRSFRTIAASGYEEEIVAEMGVWPADTPTPVKAALEAGDVRTWDSFDAMEAAFPHLAAAMRRTGERSLAIAPMLVNDEPVGALHVGFDTERELDADGRRDLRAVADAAAQAIARIRLVEAERRGRAMLVAAVDQMPMGIVVADERGGIVHANAASARIWRGTAPAQSFREYGPYRGFHRDGRPYAPEEWPIARSITTGEVVVDEEVTIRTFDHQERVISVSSAPVLGHDRERIGGVVVFGDITERRHGEELREAFVGMLSHELRTPVTSIYGAAHLLAHRAEGLDADVRGALVLDIESAATRLSQLIENLLVLARAERGVTQLDVAPVLVHHVVRRVLAQESPSWPGTSFTVEATRPGPTALADEAVVELMLRNVVGNAAKYARGAITVAVESRDGGDVVVCVRDQGPGIPDDELDRVFALFHRSASTAKAAPGSGIGLYVVRHLARAQGGDAWARNRPEGGLEVAFRLPYAASDD